MGDLGERWRRKGKGRSSIENVLPREATLPEKREGKRRERRRKIGSL